MAITQYPAEPWGTMPVGVIDPATGLPYQQPSDTYNPYGAYPPGGGQYLPQGMPTTQAGEGGGGGGGGGAPAPSGPTPPQFPPEYYQQAQAPPPAPWQTPGWMPTGAMGPGVPGEEGMAPEQMAWMAQMYPWYAQMRQTEQDQWTREWLPQQLAIEGQQAMDLQGLRGQQDLTMQEGLIEWYRESAGLDRDQALAEINAQGGWSMAIQGLATAGQIDVAAIETLGRQVVAGIQGQTALDVAGIGAGAQLGVAGIQGQTALGVAGIGAGAQLGTADIYGGAQRYGAELGLMGTGLTAGATRYGAEQAAGAQRYGAELYSGAQRYGAELGLQGTQAQAGASRYGSELGLQGTQAMAGASRYGADVASQASGYGWDTQQRISEQEAEARRRVAEMQARSQEETTAMGVWGRRSRPATRWL